MAGKLHIEDYNSAIERVQNKLIEAKAAGDHERVKFLDGCLAQLFNALAAPIDPKPEPMAAQLQKMEPDMGASEFYGLMRQPNSNLFPQYKFEPNSKKSTRTITAKNK